MSAQAKAREVAVPIRSVLVTGSSRGIGKAVRDALTCLDLHLLSSSKTMRERPEVNGMGFCPWPFFDRVAQAELVDRALSLPPPLALVHSGGVLGPTGPFESQETADWEDALECNLLAPVRLVHDLLPSMRAFGAGKIILFAGGGAAYPFPGFSSYATAKAGLVRFTETIGKELEGSGVSITIVSPGACDTDLRREVEATGLEGKPRTVTTVAEVAAFVRGLLMLDRPWLNGKFVHVRDELEGARLIEGAAYGDLWTLRRVDGFCAK